MYVVKLAVAVVVAGGAQKTDSSGMRIRGDSHLLLVGDPGELFSLLKRKTVSSQEMAVLISTLVAQQ